MRIGRRRLMPASNMIVRNEPLAWKSELSYLGISFLSADKIKYNLQTPRQKYYRALNGIFCQIGTSLQCLWFSLLSILFVFLY